MKIGMYSRVSWSSSIINMVPNPKNNQQVFEPQNQHSRYRLTDVVIGTMTKKSATQDSTLKCGHWISEHEELYLGLEA